LAAEVDHISRVALAVNTRLGGLLPSAEGPAARLMEAMRYSALAGGKRVRPYLCVRACELADGKMSDALDVACALECIHTYSLIHDDLPALDNDDLRRGQPTNHRKFDEATAILAGDGLLTLAFEIIACADLPAERTREVLREVAIGAGWSGMVGGQMADILYEKSLPREELVRFIHTRKTGALIKASVLAGAACAGADEKKTAALATFGEKCGFVFQVTDDICDSLSTPEEMGKGVGKDNEAGKQNAVSVWGVEGAGKVATKAAREAANALTPFGRSAEDLVAFVKSLPNRRK